ncbi:MAG: TonB-dependent receptor plug domain-containing protein, partial [Deltaproteobacteria bacterium]|nr:TonB-dependent receptor plug domain-containing protein [Deltaproteobacteria bacterium]
MNKIIFSSLLCLSFLAAFIFHEGVVQAQTADISMGSVAATTMDTLVVTSSRSDETLREVTTNMTILTEKDIQSTGATTLEGLLSEHGLKKFGYPGASGSIQMRGFNTDEHGNDLGSHVLILLDGLRMGTGNLALFSLVNVERVEIIRGPAASQYGAAAMGGVINVITKKGTDQPFSAALEVGGGSFHDRQIM